MKRKPLTERIIDFINALIIYLVIFSGISLVFLGIIAVVFTLKWPN